MEKEEEEFCYVTPDLSYGNKRSWRKDAQIIDGMEKVNSFCNKVEVVVDRKRTALLHHAKPSTCIHKSVDQPSMLVMRVSITRPTHFS